ncbi:GCG_CRPN prefix-to-repeats domain-containing protein [Methylorubrum populi]
MRALRLMALVSLTFAALLGMNSAEPGRIGVGRAEAAGGCGPGFHRGPYGGCRPHVYGGSYGAWGSRACGYRGGGVYGGRAVYGRRVGGVHGGRGFYGGRGFHGAHGFHGGRGFHGGGRFRR